MSLHTAPLTDQKELLTKTIITNYFFFFIIILPIIVAARLNFPTTIVVSNSEVPTIHEAIVGFTIIGDVCQTLDVKHDTLAYHYILFLLRIPSVILILSIELVFHR